MRNPASCFNVEYYFYVFYNLSSNDFYYVCFLALMEKIQNLFENNPST